MRPSVALFAALALPTAALADPVPAALSWVRAEGATACPDADALRAAVTRRLGYDPAALPSPTVSVEVVASRIDATAPWQAALYERSPDGALLGERHLDVRADTCAPLVDAIALAVAASLDGDAFARTAAAPAPEPAPTPPPATPPVAVDPPPRRSPRVRPRRWSVAASALGGLSLGALPAASPLLSLVVEVRPPSWPTLVITGLYQPGTTLDLPTGRASLRLGLAGLAVCPFRAASTTLSLTLCAGALAGVLTAAGQGLTVDRVEERPYVALEGGARARWSFTRVVHLVAEAEAVVPLIRDTLVVEGVGEVHRVSPIGLRAGIGVGVHSSDGLWGDDPTHAPCDDLDAVRPAAPR